MPARTLAAVVLSLLLFPAAARAGSLERKAAKAADAADHGDYSKAMKLGMAVLEKDPDNLDAAWAVGATMATLLSSGALPREQQASLRDATAAMLALVGQDTQNPVRAATARRLRAGLVGDTIMLPRIEPTCSAESMATFNKAETAFGEGHMADARALYDKALEGCPTNAAWVVYEGDTWMDEDQQQALATYARALDVDPCQPQAWRFTADVLLRHQPFSEVADQARQAGLSAVACEPTYDEAWITLGGVLLSSGQSPVARFDPTQDAPGWEIYQQALAAAEGSDALDRRVAAVRAVLRQGTPETPLWGLISNASGKGMLEEAILFDLLDKELIPVYLTERVERLPRMKAYVEALHVVP